MRLKKTITLLFLFSTTLIYTKNDSKISLSNPPTSQQSVYSPSEAPPSSNSSTSPHLENQEVPPPLPSSSEMTTSYEGAFVRMLATLAGLILLVVATFWVLRRLGRGGGKFKMGGGGRLINVIERRAVSPKTMLYIVEIGHKKVLISESQLEVRALTTLEELPETNE